MNLRPSFYNHYTDHTDDQTILFNKFWGSVGVVPRSVADHLRAGTVDRLDTDRAQDLTRAGFLVTVPPDGERSAAHDRYTTRRMANSLLGITVELTQECNLACTFCYQNDYRGTGAITDESIGRIGEYIRTVVTQERRPFREIALRFIGGEPLLQKAKVLDAVSHVRRVADDLGLSLNTQMDTNGLLLDENVVREMDATSITITNKADHDTVRVRHNGAGSYDQILGRLRRHAEHYNRYGTVLAVRYNVNAFNAKYVGDVYRMVKDLGIRYTQFDVFHTVNHSFNVLVPTLSPQRYKQLYLDVIRMKVQQGEIVTDFPRPAFAPCSAYTPYNLKVSADGKLALCDAMTTPRGDLADVSVDPDALRRIFADIDGHDPFDDPQCRTCSNVGICGGKLYCKPDPCDFLPFDLDDFLRFFVPAYAANPERFDLGAEVG